jgi:hypothetical protein
MTADSIKDALIDKLNNPYNVDFTKIAESTTLAGGIVELLTGLACYILTIGLSIIIAIEVVYLVFPNAKTAIDSYREKGNKKRLRLVLRDADRAYDKYIQSNGEKSAIAAYIKIKFKSIIIVGVVVSLLVMGGPIIVGITNNIVQGILSSVKK